MEELVWDIELATRPDWYMEHVAKEEPKSESEAAARAGLYTDHEAEAVSESNMGARASHLKPVKEESVWDIELATQPNWYLEHEVKEELKSEGEVAARAGLYTDHEAEAVSESNVGARASHLKPVKEDPVWDIELATQPDWYLEHEVKEKPKSEGESAAPAGLYTDHEAEAVPESNMGARASHLKPVKEEPVWDIELATQPDWYLEHEVKEGLKSEGEVAARSGLYTDHEAEAVSESNVGARASHLKPVKEQPVWDIELATQPDWYLEHEVKEEPKSEGEVAARSGLYTDHEAEAVSESNVGARASHLKPVKEQPVWDIELATQPDWYLEHEVKEEPKSEGEAAARAGLYTDHEAEAVSESNVGARASHLKPVKEQPVWDIELATQPDWYLEHEVKEEPKSEGEAAARAGLYTDHEAEAVSESNVGARASHLKPVKEEPVWDIEIATIPDWYMEHVAKELESEAGSQAGHVEHEVKEEPVEAEEDTCAAALAGLYPDHTVKEELVVGPKEMHRPKVTLVLPGPTQQEYRRNHQEMKTSMNDKPYKCSQCIYATDQKKYLKRHEKVHTKKKPYKCTHCSYASIYMSALKSHEMTHTCEKPYKCTHCSFASFYMNSLKSHKITHIGEKSYQCAHCSYASFHKSALKSHEMTHTGEKPYKCTHCSFPSVYMSSLKSHEITHTGKKPNKSAHCSYSSAHERFLKYHEKAYTGEKPYKCTYCSYAGVTKSDLHYHRIARYIVVEEFNRYYKF